MREALNIADRALAAPQYHGTTARSAIMELMGKARDLPEAVDYMEELADAANSVMRDLQIELSVAQIAQGTPLQAAAWFLENVPLDASWRSEAFFALRERIREPQPDDPTITLVAMRGDVQVAFAINDGDRVVRVNSKSLIEAGYSVTDDGPKWVAFNGDWTSSVTNSRWGAWALAQEHFTKGKTE